jgi:hypothetical protein
MLNKFFQWYENNFKANLYIATFLFVLQLFHLYWLFSDVILTRLVGQSYFLLEPVWGQISIFFDYTEIPAIITTTLLYIHLLKKEFSYKSLIMILLVNSQWIHLLWITDEFVVAQFSSHEFIAFSYALSWVAILIDYLELPVIYDTLKQTVKSLRQPTTPPPQS